MIKLQHLTKRLGKKTVFEELNCDIAKGEVVGVLGKSDSGKTILLDMIIGLKKPNTGNIIIEDKNIFEDIFETRRKIGYMSETPIYKEMIVKDYLNFMLKVKGKEEFSDVTNNYIEVFGLRELENTLVGNLSSSDNKKLAIVTAYIGLPKIILLDEPFVGLELSDVKIAKDFIKNNKNKFTTIIATSKEEHLEDICDKVIIIHKTQIVAYIDIKELKKSKKDLKTLFEEVTSEGEKND